MKLGKREKVSYQVTTDDIKRTKRIAGKMARKWEPGLVNYDDILGDGLEGLAKAARHFDETKDKEFWMYATVCVRRAIADGLCRRFGRDNQKLALAKAAPLVLTDDYGSEWSPHEIPVEDTGTGRDLLEKIRQMGLGPQRTCIMIMLAAGYKQHDIIQETEMSKASVNYHVLEIRRRFSVEQFAEIIST